MFEVTVIIFVKMTLYKHRNNNGYYNMQYYIEIFRSEILLYLFCNLLSSNNRFLSPNIYNVTS